MDQKQIEEIVRSVMASMGQAAPAPSEAKCATTNCAAPVTSESCALDLGSAEAKAWIGVENPHRADVLTELRRSTVARVCTGRAGPRPRTQALLRFLADHSRSKDTVLKEVPEEWVKAQGLLEVRSEISDKNLYLTRPDMGRRLCAEAVEALKAQCVANPDVQVVISDGLSTDAITVNYEEILPPLMAGLKQAGLKVGTPFFVRYGRVKIEDQIGEILGAKVVILLVGERPGLGQSESLSCYAVYSPRMATTVEADRTCISNIHQGGTPPVEAAAVIVDLAKRMLEQKASGINMTREGGIMPALDLIRPSVTAMRVTAESISHQSYRRLLSRAREYVLENMSEPVTVLDLCNQLHVSRRTLQNAFHAILGIGPNAWLKRIRLNAVRRELISPWSQSTTVKDAAMQWGFWHLGQFATDYQQLFAEKPSLTLHQRMREWG